MGDHGLSGHGGSDSARRETSGENRDGESGSVAIIGMACRFPGASTPAQFWSNLIGEVESVTFEQDTDTDTDADAVEAGWIRAGATLDDIEGFDAEFFGYTPRDAALLDPQHRLFLEVCWEALEDGGAAGKRRIADIGVYGGSGASLYLMNNLRGQASRPLPNFLDSTGDLQLAMAADRDFLTSRVSYKLNLNGPSVNVQAACATSLYALHLACQALAAGECDMALAGGAHVPVPQIGGYRYEPGLILSQDGHCRAFDARATGTVFGSGVGVVLLKPLERALADNDRVYAVIRGTAVNNDGSGKPGFSAPSVAGQAAVIRQALAAADLEPESISYVEAHGTATLAGDPIEVAALTDAFAGVRPGSCALGSVKTNIGHLSWAGGIAGVIKVALALWHRRLPASLNFQHPNPAIDFSRSPFYIQSETTDWPAHGAVRRAGVSAFGLGGTNAHAILEQAPIMSGSEDDEDDLAGDEAPGIQVLPISGRTEPALREMAARISSVLSDDTVPNLADVAVSLGDGRTHFAHRAAAVGSDRKTLAAILDAVAHGQRDVSDTFEGEIGLSSGVVRAPRPRPAALFAGQGAEYLEACRDLYVSETVFRKFIDGADERFREQTGHGLSNLLYQDAARRGMPIADIRLAQPVNYVLQAALLDLWSSWGLVPKIYLGHSLGEYAAAHGAGVFDFETGLYLVCERAKLLDTLPESGAMASISASEHDVLELLDGQGRAGIAAVNAPRSVVISGDGDAVRSVVAAAEKRGLKCKKLRISRAAHSAQLDPVLDTFSAVLERVEMRAPTRTMVSTLTGAVIDEEIARTDYWRRQLRQPVRFADAVRAAAAVGADVFVEIGVSNTLAGLTQLALDDTRRTEPVACLETLRWERNDLVSTRLALAGAYAAGVAVDWGAVCSTGRIATLPTYPFQRRRHWIPSVSSSGEAPIGRVGEDLMEPLEAADTDETDSKAVKQYVLAWLDAPEPPSAPTAKPMADRKCLVIVPAVASAAQFAGELERLGAEVLVHAPSGGDDAAAGIERALTGYRPTMVINLAPALYRRHADLGGFPLHTDSVSDDVVAAGGAVALQTFQAVSAANLPEVTVCTVTSGAHRVLTSDDVVPAQGAIIGIARTARTELTNARHLLIDLGVADTRHHWAAHALPRLAAAIGSVCGGDAELALRGDRVLLPRLRPGRRTSGTARTRIDPNGWYLVIGGQSGIGLECARVLLELGAARLVLCSRTAPDGERAEQLRRLRREFDADVRTEKVDVTSPRQVEQLFASYSAGEDTVRGVIHAAGILDDGIIDRLDWSRIARVLGPKAQGAWNLHRSAAVHAPELDLFVMTSSYGGLFGNPGQAGHAAANTFLDALAAYRQSVGLAGLSMDLGSWSDVGVLAGNADFLRQLEERGIGTISSSEGRPAIRAVLESRSAGQVAVLPTRWSDLDPEHHLASNPVLSGLVGAHGEPFSTDPPSPAALTPAEIKACCVEVVARELGYDLEEIEGLDLAGAGMDSLNALTIRNKLQQRLAVPLPASICFDNPVFADLAADIEKRLMEVHD